MSPKEAASKLHVHPRTLVRMAERGELSPVTLPSGHRRYSRAEIEEIISRDTGITDLIKAGHEAA